MEYFSTGYIFKFSNSFSLHTSNSMFKYTVVESYAISNGGFYLPYFYVETHFRKKKQLTM